MNQAIITGEQLATQIRTRAAQLGVPLVEFIRPISRNSSNWINQLAAAGRPKPHTIDRVRALLQGQPVARPPASKPPRPPHGERSFNVVKLVADENPLPAIDRDPCMGCGVRADRHDDSGCRRWRRA